MFREDMSIREIINQRFVGRVVAIESILDDGNRYFIHGEDGGGVNVFNLNTGQPIGVEYVLSDLLEFQFRMVSPLVSDILVCIIKKGGLHGNGVVIPVSLEELDNLNIKELREEVVNVARSPIQVTINLSTNRCWGEITLKKAGLEDED